MAGNGADNVGHIGIGGKVADHYNKLEEKGKEHRQESRIYYMRNFNNWTKSMLIQEYSDKVKASRPELQRSRNDGFQRHDRGRNHHGGYGSQYHDRRGGYNSHGRQNERHHDGYNRHDNRNNRDSYNYENRDQEEHREREDDSNVDKTFSVLDLGCGKGGDLLKWSKAGVDQMTCVDIAQTSVEQAKGRYNDMKQKNRGRLFKADFFAADCTKTRLLDRYPNSQNNTGSDDVTNSPKFDIVSCQFAFHYSFESEAQAECMVKNAAENLKPGGFFIGTTPDAEVIWKRLREAQSPEEGKNTFGNSVYSVEFAEDSPILTAQNPSMNENRTQGKLAGKMPKDLPKFGVGYNFHLEGVVDCPEFLVNFDALCDIATRHGLVLVAKQGFENFFKAKRDTREGANLLRRINALEPYRRSRGKQLVGDDVKNNYRAAEEYLEKLKNCGESHSRNNPVKPDLEPIFVLEDRNDREFCLGTLSKEEWDAITFYCVFAFKKIKT